MDEKGCQRGGGRRGVQQKYFYSKNQQSKYRIQSANLELITIIEAICADDTSLRPGFVFPGSSFCPEWFENHPDIVCVYSNIDPTLSMLIQRFSVSRCHQMDGLMTLLDLNGLRSHLSLRQLYVSLPRVWTVTVDMSR